MLEYALILTALSLMLMATVNVVGRAINGTYCQISVGLSLAKGGGCTVSAWGEDGAGELGDNSTTTRATPAVIAKLGPLLQLSSGFEHNLALAQDGTVWAWGLAGSGQLGNGSNTDTGIPQHITFPASFTNIVQVSAGSYDSMALKSDGTIWTWGDNSYGQMAGSVGTAGCAISVYTCPSQVPQTFDTSAKPTAVAGSHMSEYVLMSDGTVWSWGSNQTGQLGNNTWGGTCCTGGEGVNTPVQVQGLPVRATAIAGNQNDTMYAIGADGNVYAWGNNQSGQLGNGGISSGCGGICSQVATIVQIPGYPKIVAIAGGANCGYAIDASGNGWGWGDNTHDQLTSLASNPQNIPYKMFTSSSGIVAISGGGEWTGGGANEDGFVLALTNTGGVLGWGDNTTDELGTTGGTTWPTALSIPGETKVNAVVAGGFSSYLLNTKETGSG
jgi:alpha-tubulin suppressor-like RCC1 family protein